MFPVDQICRLHMVCVCTYVCTTSFQLKNINCTLASRFLHNNLEVFVRYNPPQTCSQNDSKCFKQILWKPKQNFLFFNLTEAVASAMQPYNLYG